MIYPNKDALSQSVCYLSVSVNTHSTWKLEGFFFSSFERLWFPKVDIYNNTKKRQKKYFEWLNVYNQVRFRRAAFQPQFVEIFFLFTNIFTPLCWLELNSERQQNLTQRVNGTELKVSINGTQLEVSTAASLLLVWVCSTCIYSSAKLWFFSFQHSVIVHVEWSTYNTKYLISHTGFLVPRTSFLNLESHSVVVYTKYW